MIVRKFIQWSQGASAAARADGVAALARAYLYSEMTPEERRDAECALYALLDDPSPLPRRAMAECFAGSPDAPPALIHGLARDQSEISTLVLTRSPLLADADLIDCAAVGDGAAQAAIALRAELSPAVCGSLAEIGGREAAIVLAVNESASIPDFALRRMVERFGEDGEVREALLGRAWLPATVRAHLADATARALAAFVVSRQWLSAPRGERIAQENRDRATMIIASGCAEYSEETAALAAYLRVAGQITPGVALRALLCGQKGLFEATLAELTGLSAKRIAGVAREPWSEAFAAVYAKAGFPAGSADRLPLGAGGAGANQARQRGRGRIAPAADPGGARRLRHGGSGRVGQCDLVAAPVRTRRGPRAGAARGRPCPDAGDGRFAHAVRFAGDADAAPRVAGRGHGASGGSRRAGAGAGGGLAAA